MRISLFWRATQLDTNDQEGNVNMKKKKVLILGAGVYQVPLIKKAKKLGFYTIVTSKAGEYPGFSFADKAYFEDIINYEAILEIARAEEIDGIVTAGTDVAIITIGRVCDALGLKGLSFETAKIACNKFLMKSKYKEFGVRTAKFRKVPFDLDAIKNMTKELRLPLIFKVVDSSGSRGIIRVNTADEFEHALEYVKSATKQDYFIAEEFLEGTEFGAQAFVYNGKIQFILPHGDYVFVGDTGVPIGHYAPYEVDDDLRNDIETQLGKAVEAMRLDNCAINADLILVDGKVYVLELGGRSGATCLAELTSIYYGFDYYEKILRVSVGENVDFSSGKKTPSACMLLTSEKSGTIKSQKNNNKDTDDILEVQFDHKVGDIVYKFKVGPDRIGHVITKGDTLSQAVLTLNEALTNIKIEVE